MTIEQNKSPDSRSKLFYRGAHRARRGTRTPALSAPETTSAPSVAERPEQ